MVMPNKRGAHKEEEPLYGFSGDYRAASTGRVYVEATGSLVDPDINHPLNQYVLRELVDWAHMPHDRNMLIDVAPFLNVLISTVTACAEIRAIVRDKYEVNFMHLAAAYDARPGLTPEDRFGETMVAKMAAALQVQNWKALSTRSAFGYTPSS